MRIILAQDYKSAKEAGKFNATVEAEYGVNVIKGTDITLAHHSEEFKNCPAPCNTKVSKALKCDVLISHVDLDTIGGIMAIWGVKPEQNEFWAGAEYIDIHGPHHIHSLSKEVQALLNAYYFFNNEIDRCNIPKECSIHDVTEYVNRQIDFLQSLLTNENFKKEYVKKGKEYAIGLSNSIEGRLVEETSKYRLFSTDKVFCGGAYYSPKQNKAIPAIVSFNEIFKTITLSFEDGGIKQDAVKIMQEIFGSEAGGRPGIAGTPRGEEFEFNDVKKILEYLK